MLKNNRILLIAISLIYILLGVICLNYPYFWDNIHQTSREAHWFFENGFGHLFMPKYSVSNAEYAATGYHPPLMAIMTALLWRIFGCHLWVSHLFSMFWAVILIYNVLKLSDIFFDKKLSVLVSTVILVESTLLTQFAIASPDFILVTALVLSLRGILEKKSLLMFIGLFFLFGINMRGVFAGMVLFFSFVYYFFLTEKSRSFSMLISRFLPFLLVFVFIGAYYAAYFIVNGWFFGQADQGGHYSRPENVGFVIKHLAELGLRMLENGRFVVYITLSISIILVVLRKRTLDAKTKMLLVFFAGLFLLYLLFVFITRMPFASRYFLPLNVVATLVVFILLRNFSVKEFSVKWFVVVCLVFELTGNFWIYPEAIAKSWDGTLAHLSYYPLRKECFDYIDQNNIPYDSISAGFCLYGQRKMAELTDNNGNIGSEPNRPYFIYSNISNVPDEWLVQLKNHAEWKLEKEFTRYPVTIILYKRCER